jgi:hypothetical protein
MQQFAMGWGLRRLGQDGEFLWKSAEEIEAASRAGDLIQEIADSINARLRKGDAF